MTLLVADPLPDAMSERQACDALDVCRNSLRAARKRYFFCGPPSPYRRKRKETVQPKALSAQEREQVKEVLYSDEYANQPPVQVYYSLLDQNISFVLSCYIHNSNFNTLPRSGYVQRPAHWRSKLARVFA